MARIGPNDRIGPPLVTYSPEQLAEIDALRARIAALEGELRQAEARDAVVRDEAETAASMIHRRVLDGTVSRKEKIVLRRLREALYDTAPPSVQALTRLVEAVGRTVEAFERESSKEEHAALAKEVTAAYRAYQAARSGRGEVVPTPNRTRRDRIEGAVRAIETLQAHGIYLHDAVGTPLGGAEFLAVMPSILEAMKDQPPAPGPATKETP